MSDERKWLNQHRGRLFCGCSKWGKVKRTAIVATLALTLLASAKVGAAWARTRTNELPLERAAVIAVEPDPASAELAAARLRYLSETAVRALLECSQRDDDAGRDAAIALYELRRLLYDGGTGR